ncbi:MAG: hypothetical protein ABII16_03570, partial [Patescibacteria group bacterium]
MRLVFLSPIFATIIFLLISFSQSFAACPAGSKDFWRDDSAKCPLVIAGVAQCSYSGTTLKSISKKDYFECCCQFPYELPVEAVGTALGVISAEPDVLIADVLSLILGIAGGIAFLLLLAGAFGYITSSGSPDAVMGAKSTITAALTGLAVIIFSV